MYRNTFKKKYSTLKYEIKTVYVVIQKCNQFKKKRGG